MLQGGTNVLPFESITFKRVKISSVGKDQSELSCITCRNVKGYNFLRCYLFLFRERGRERGREKNINVWLPLARPLLGTWPATQSCALTGNQTSDALVRRPTLCPLSYTSQGRMQQFFLNSLAIPLELSIYLLYGTEFHS